MNGMKAARQHDSAFYIHKGLPLLTLSVALSIWSCADSDNMAVEHDIKYLITSTGDTTIFSYRTQHNKWLSETIAHDTYLVSREIVFKTTDGTELGIIAQSRAKSVFGARMAYVAAYIYVDGVIMAHEEKSASEGECNCSDYGGLVDESCTCTVGVSSSL